MAGPEDRFREYLSENPLSADNVEARFRGQGNIPTTPEEAAAEKRRKIAADISPTLSSVNKQIAGAVGMPVDLVRGGLGAVGVPVAPPEKTFGSSENIRNAFRDLGLIGKKEEPETPEGKFVSGVMGGAATAPMVGGATGKIIKE